MAQRVGWEICWSGGSSFKEWDAGKETIFTDILNNKSSFTSIKLLNIETQEMLCGIDLVTGRFNVGGKIIRLCRNVDGRNYDFTDLKLNYSDGVIQYKCTKEMGMMEKVVKVKTFNIGYKVDLSSVPFFNYLDGSAVTHFQPMFSVENDTLEVSVSMQYTVRMPDGKEIRI